MRRFLIALLLLLLPDCQLTASEPEGTLKTAAEVRTLPREKAHEGLPVSLSGVVTFTVLHGRGDGPNPVEGFILQDQTAGVYVAWPDAPSQKLTRIKEGDVLRVQGTTHPGGFAPSIRLESLFVEGSASIPKGPLIAPHELWSGRYDCQPVTLEGVVQRIEINSFDVAQIEIATESGLFPVFVNRARSLEGTEIVDAKLRISGICFSSYNSRGELNGIQIRAATPSSIQILEPGNPEPFSAPEAHALALMPFRQEPPNLHRQRITGTVTMSRPGKFFYLQTPLRNFRIETHQEAPLTPGDRVEASGFVAKSPSFAVLREAVFRKLAKDPPPAPQPVEPEALLGWPRSGTALRLEDYDGQLIRIEGRLLKIEPEESNGRRVYFEADRTVRFAILPPETPAGKIAHLQSGSDIALTGICVQHLDTPWLRINRTKSVGFHLLLRGPDDIVIKNAPPWWTKERLAWALGSAAFILAALGVWIFSLRRLVAAQTRLLSETIANESRLEERQRIGRELHDTLLQELTGITRLIGNAKRHLDDPKKATETLSMAERMAHRCNAESRSSVQDLMSISLENGGLPMAIDELVRPLASIADADFQTFIPQDLGRHDARIETAILRIAHEAVANALKHSKASHVVLSLEKLPDFLRLTVSDNGSGFERPKNSSASAHFGLLGMEERAIRAGGRLEIESASGTGTKVVASFPLP